jgi:hypothetical protein
VGLPLLFAINIRGNEMSLITEGVITATFAIAEKESFGPTFEKCCNILLLVRHAFSKYYFKI